MHPMQWTSDNSIDWHDAAERRLAVRANPSAFTVLALCASKIFAKRDDGLAVTVRIQNPRPMTLAAPKDWCRKRGHRLFVGPSMKRRCESIIPHVWLLCPNCRSRFQDAHGDLKQYSCSVCGNATLVRVRSEQERSRDALAGMAAGAAVGAAIGELPGALIGGIIGLVLGALRTPTIEQSKR